MTAKSKYNQYLAIITKNFHNNTSTNVELNKLGKEIFGKQFIGVYSIDTIPSYKNDKTLIFNLDTSDKPGSHWCGLYYLNDNIYIYDSFARSSKQILKNKIKNLKWIKKKYKIILTNSKSDQKVSETNCGQRCLAWLCVALFHGVDKAMKV